MTPNAHWDISRLFKEAVKPIFRFKVENAGTHFWHAHSGQQRADGIFGALVVRQAAENEAHLGLYEEDLPEHTMLVHDWLVELSVNRFAHHHHAGGDNKPRSMLINGKYKKKYIY